MSAGDDTPAYGHTDGPQDGQIKPIPVPSGPGDQLGDAERAVLAKRQARRKSLEGLVAVGGGLATAVFLLLGFVFDAWAWAWIVYLLPGLLGTYLAASE